MYIYICMRSMYTFRNVGCEEKDSIKSFVANINIVPNVFYICRRVRRRGVLLWQKTESDDEAPVLEIQVVWSIPFFSITPRSTLSVFTLEGSDIQDE